MQELFEGYAAHLRQHGCLPPLKQQSAANNNNNSSSAANGPTSTSSSSSTNGPSAAANGTAAAAAANNNNGSSGADAATGEDNPLTWVLHYLAQHYDQLGSTGQALEHSTAALGLAPKVIELLLARAKILKHAGDAVGAAVAADAARRADLADRWVQCVGVGKKSDLCFWCERCLCVLLVAILCFCIATGRIDYIHTVIHWRTYPEGQQGHQTPPTGTHQPTAVMTVCFRFLLPVLLFTHPPCASTGTPTAWQSRRCLLLVTWSWRSRRPCCSHGTGTRCGVLLCVSGDMEGKAPELLCKDAREYSSAGSTVLVFASLTSLPLPLASQSSVLLSCLPVSYFPPTTTTTPETTQPTQ